MILNKLKNDVNNVLFKINDEKLYYNNFILINNCNQKRKNE